MYINMSIYRLVLETQLVRLFMPMFPSSRQPCRQGGYHVSSVLQFLQVV